MTDPDQPAPSHTHALDPSVGAAARLPASAPGIGCDADSLEMEIDQALALLFAGVDRLLQIGDRGDLLALGPARLITLAQRFETHRTRLGAVDALIVEAAADEALEKHTGTASLPLALASVLRISRATARARVARSRQIMPATTFSTGTSNAELPLLAEAVRAGSISSDQVSVVGVAMRTLRTNPHISSEDARTAERVLIEHAGAFGPDDLRTVAAKIDDVLLPDGVLPRESVARARRGVSIGAVRRDGTHPIGGSLTREACAQILSVLSPLAAPRPADEMMGPDDRTQAQRMHDALQDAFSRLLDSPGLPRSGGTPATVHLIVDADRLTAAVAATTNASPAGPDSSAAAVTSDAAHAGRDSSAAGGSDQPGSWLGADGAWRYSSTRAAGATGFGTQVTFPEIVRLAEQAVLIPTFLSATNGIVAYGSQRRLATEGQTNALIARDQGCSFPGCHAPPQWCERHHVIPWYRSGATDLSNLTLVCGFHHREFEARGWRVVMHHGRPAWIPPEWIDPEQVPLFNTRIQHAGTAQLDLHLNEVFGDTEPGSAADSDSRPARHHPARNDPADSNQVGNRTAGRTSADPRCPGGSHGPAESPDTGDARGPSGDESEALDPIDALTELLGKHINAEEREEFHYELDYLIDSYIGPHAPANRYLEPVA